MRWFPIVDDTDRELAGAEDDDDGRAAAVEAVREAVVAMEALGLDGVAPAIAFDPRWHD